MVSAITRGGVVMCLSDEKVDLRHIFKIEIYNSIGPYEQDEVILYNADKINEATALEVVRAGAYSEYVLHLSKRQFDALFLNKEGDPLWPLV